MNSDAQKIITVLQMLSNSLEDESSILRIQKWIKETEISEKIVKPAVREPKQVLMDTRRNLLREVKRIETSLQSVSKLKTGNVFGILVMT